MVEVRLENVSKRFGSFQVLRRISFTAPRSRITAILGPSGCGKTTTLRIVAGLEKADSGRVLFDGKDVSELEARKRDIGMIFQSLALFPTMKVVENVMFGLLVGGTPREEARKEAMSLLKMMRLERSADKYPHQLSWGEKQRVAIARAIAPKPRILLLDEPFSNLDPPLREKLLWEMKDLQRGLRITLIHVTHDREEAFALADHVILMDNGEVLAEGDPEKVMEDPGCEKVARFLGANVLELPGRFLRAKVNKVRIFFYPEDVREGGPIRGFVIGYLFSRGGYRTRVQVGRQVVEILLRRRTEKGDLVSFLPIKWGVLGGRCSGRLHFAN